VSDEPLLNLSEAISVACPREKCLPQYKVEDPGWASQVFHCPVGALSKRRTETRSHKVNRWYLTTMRTSRGLEVPVAPLVNPGGVSSQTKYLSGPLGCDPVVCPCQCVVDVAVI